VFTSHGSAAPRQAPKVSLITVTYNSANALRECWSRFDPDWAEWIVVDNHSTDDSVSIAESLGATPLRLVRNVGFSAANNIAASLTDADVLIFCNPDVVVDAPGIARIANRAMSAPCLIAPQLANSDGTLQENGRGAPYPHRKLRHMLGRRDEPDLAYVRIARAGELRSAVWAMGAAVGMSRSTFDAIRGWDSRYFIYYEDADICLRALDQGIPTYIDGDIVWTHKWARETARGLSVPAWKREISSGLKFYARNTHCVLPIGASGRRLRKADAESR
jgi:N-acetylglucosaminyl-diphospho-decaprenol L-rhamnosyltransferase